MKCSRSGNVDMITTQPGKRRRPKKEGGFKLDLENLAINVVFKLSFLEKLGKNYLCNLQETNFNI